MKNWLKNWLFTLFVFGMFYKPFKQCFWEKKQDTRCPLLLLLKTTTGWRASTWSWTPSPWDVSHPGEGGKMDLWRMGVSRRRRYYHLCRFLPSCTIFCDITACRYKPLLYINKTGNGAISKAQKAQSFKIVNGGTLWAFWNFSFSLWIQKKQKSRTVSKKIHRGPYHHVRFCILR